MGNWNENQIKDAIVQGRKDGICDKNGNTIKYRDGRLPNGQKEKVRKGKMEIFGTKLLNIWPRDKKGQLIGAS